MSVGRMRLQRSVIGLFLSVPRSVVALRIELSAPWLSAEDGQPALDYRVFRQAARMGIEPIFPP